MFFANFIHVFYTLLHKKLIKALFFVKMNDKLI